MQKKNFILLTILAVAFRIVLLPFFEQPFDIKTWSEEIPQLLNDFFGLYVNSPMTAKPANPIFPPLFYFYLGGIFYLFPAKIQLLTVLGLVNVLADICTGLMIYKFTFQEENIKNRNGYYSYILWLFSPVVWVTSAVWKELDPITTMLTVASFLALEKKKISISAILLAFATLFKLYPLIFLPIFVVQAHQLTRKVEDLIKWFFTFICVFTLVSVPFLIRGFPEFVYHVFWINYARGTAYAADIGTWGPRWIDGINFLFFMRVHYTSGYFEYVRSLEFLVTVANVGKLLFWALVLTLFLRKKISFRVAMLATWTFYFSLSPSVNEQLFVLPLAFLLLGLAGDRLSRYKVFIFINVVWLVFEELRMGLDSAYIFGSRIYQYSGATAYIDRNFYGLLLDWQAQVIILSILGILMSTFLIHTSLKLVKWDSVSEQLVLWLRKWLR